MSTNIPTLAPADLLGLGGADARRCTGLDSRLAIGVSPAPCVAPFRGTAVPAGIAARLRPAFQARPEVQVSAWNLVAANTVAETAVVHNSIGTTLGIHPSGRPLS